MPLLLRLLLCLTLLANTAGGAWAASGVALLAGAATPSAAGMTAGQPSCHEAADVAPALQQVDAHAGARHAQDGQAGGDHCASHGCNCLQHCAWSFVLAGVPAPVWPRSRAALPDGGDGSGLPQPYQPIRPPIA